MANFEAYPEFTEQLRRFETTDPAHAELFNAAISILLNNDVFLKMISDQLIQEIRQHVADRENPHEANKDQIGLGKVDNTSDQEKPISTAQQNALDDLYQQLAAYTNQKIAGLINGAPESLDTLKEVANAIAEHKTVMDALDAAIGKKASAAEFDSHTKDITKHITVTERTAWNAKMETTGDSGNNTVAFTSGDATNPTGWADIAQVTSGEKHSSLFRKISLAVKNVRYLYKLIGTADISAIGGGTLTGAINALNTGINMVVGKFTPANANYSIDLSSYINKNSVLGIANLRIEYTGAFPTGNYYQVATATICPSRLTFLQVACLNSNVQCNAYFYQDGIIKVNSLQPLTNPVFLISGCFV